MGLHVVELRFKALSMRADGVPALSSASGG